MSLIELHPNQNDVSVDPIFEVQLADGTTERVVGATAYAQEQCMTTFFYSDRSRQSLDSWSMRIMSIRTEHIQSIRRLDHHSAPSYGVATVIA